MKKKIKIIAILLGLIILMASGILYTNRTRYGLTPEDASKLYLQTVTSSYKILDIKSAQINGDSARCGIVSEDNFNWLNRNNGRADGENIHVFELKKTQKGWYVVSDNAGR